MFGDWDWDPTDELRVATALTGVQKSLTSDGEPPPKGAKIVFTVLENVSDIEQRQHNGRRVGPTGYRTYWPPIKHIRRNAPKRSSSA